MASWTKTEYPGVYARQHPTRKHGVKRDTYYAITYRLDGKKKWEAIGWASEGNTASEANEALTALKKNQRIGEGAQTMLEKRKIKKAEVDADKAEAERLASAALTFDGFWDAHYWPAQAHKSASSLETETGLKRKWIAPVIGKRPLVEIASIHLERVKSDMMKAGLSASTIKYAFAVVSQVWTQARRDGFVSGDCPTKQVKRPKINNKRERYLSPREAETLLERLAVRSPVSHDLAVLSLYAGLRFSEAASLTWKDVDFNHGIISIRDPKAKKNRSAFISKPIREVLERLKEKREDDGLIFKSRTGAVSHRVSNAFQDEADDLFNKGVADKRQRVVFHTLRHTFASWVAQSGVSLYHLKELMGHEDFKMTQRYSHLAPDGLRTAAMTIEDNLTKHAEAEAFNYVALASANEKGNR